MRAKEGEPEVLLVQGGQRGQRSPLHAEEPLQRADGDRGRDDTVVRSDQLSSAKGDEMEFAATCLCALKRVFVLERKLLVL